MTFRPFAKSKNQMEKFNTIIKIEKLRKKIRDKNA